jgi:hypothetical protein
MQRPQAVCDASTAMAQCELGTCSGAVRVTAMGVGESNNATRTRAGLPRVVGSGLRLLRLPPIREEPGAPPTVLSCVMLPPHNLAVGGWACNALMSKLSLEEQSLSSNHTLLHTCTVRGHRIVA